MTLNFNDIANTKVADVEAVPLPPQGTYRWRITKLPSIRDFKGGDGTEYQSVEFPIQVVAPMEDVDPSDYKGNLADIRQNLSFMFNKADEVAFVQMQNRLKKFLSSHLKVGNEDMSFKELFNESVNQQFLAPITWAPDKNDPEVMRVRVGNTAPLD
jgi:hypothetical protein